MTDELFIKEIEDYFFEGEPMGEYSMGRIRGWLKKYRDAIDVPDPVILHKEKVVYVEKIVEVDNGVWTEQKPLATPNEIEREGRNICDAYGVDYKIFVKAKYGKSTCAITEVRKKFVRHLMENYAVERIRLQEYFGVDHTTISYYINGKPYKRKNNGTTKALS